MTSGDVLTLADIQAAVTMLEANHKRGKDYQIFVHEKSVANFILQHGDIDDHVNRVISAMREGESPFDAEARLKADDDFIQKNGIRAWYRKVSASRRR